MDFPCPHRLNAGNIVLIKQSYCSWINVSIRVDILSTCWKGDNKLNWKYTKKIRRRISLRILAVADCTQSSKYVVIVKKNRWTTKRERSSINDQIILELRCWYTVSQRCPSTCDDDDCRPRNVRDLTWSRIYSNNKSLTKSTFNMTIKWTKHQFIALAVISLFFFIKWLDFYNLIMIEYLTSIIFLSSTVCIVSVRALFCLFFYFAFTCKQESINC